MNRRKNIYIYVGVVAAFLLSSLFHFAYDFLGRPPFLAGLFPISESIWEHMKLPFYSLFLVNLIPWCEFVKKLSVRDGFVLAAFQSEISMLIIFGGYYGLKSGFGREGIWIDLGLLFTGMLIALIASAYITEDSVHLPNYGKWYFLGKWVLTFWLFWIFSFVVPNYPIFR